QGRVDRAPVAQALSAPEFARSRLRAKPLAVVGLVLVGFLAGVPPSLMAATGAALLLITPSPDPRRVSAAVDWGLVGVFLGLFVIIGGAERAGLTDTVLRPFAAWNLHRLAVFVPATAVLCNIVSNVPAVMLLRTLVPTSPDPHNTWLALAMASTLAGNLTIT